MAEKSEKCFELFTSLTVYAVRGLYSRIDYGKDINTNFWHPADFRGWDL